MSEPRKRTKKGTKRRTKRKSKSQNVSNVASGSAIPNEDESVKKAPHSFIFHRGKVGRYVLKLIRDLRRLMEPYTAVRLKANKKNVLKDFVAVAGPLGVTHFVIFTRNDEHINVRLIRVPRGPTLTFRVQGYVLARDVISSLKKPSHNQAQFRHHPLIVMNNFKNQKANEVQEGPADGKHVSLMQTMLQNMFPSININTVQLRSIRRCVLFNYDQETDTVDWRHYTVKVAPTGLSRSAKKLLPSRKKIPDLGRYKDISDYFLTPGQLSESEFEADAQNEVELPQDVPGVAGLERSSEAAVRLVELGPRLTLQLIKVETGISEGEVLYHKYIKKTARQVAKQRTNLTKRRKLKEARRSQQEENVKRKRKSENSSPSPARKKQKNEQNVDTPELEGEISGDQSQTKSRRPRKKVIVSKVKRASK